MDKDVIHEWTFKDQVSLWDANTQRALCCSLQASPPPGLRRLERNRANWWQDSNHFHACAVTVENELPSARIGKPSWPERTDAGVRRGLDRCKGRWNWRKQMAEEELQPGSLCQALGLKFHLNFLFVCFLKQTGEGERGGRGGEGRETRERELHATIVYWIFYLNSQDVSKLQCGLLV